MEKVKIQNIQVHPADGLKETLKQMQNLEILSLLHSNFRNFVTDNFNPNCNTCLPRQIWEYMQVNFNYIEDEFDEQITAPYLLIETKRGDCDDFALFAKTCLHILGGWHTHYLLLAQNFNQFTHIVCFAYTGRNIFSYVNPRVIDGANEEFNVVANKYKFRKII